jgi:hypothetical protein
MIDIVDIPLDASFDLSSEALYSGAFVHQALVVANQSQWQHIMIYNNKLPVAGLGLMVGGSPVCLR